ncbi:hypothetical protein PTSG_05161 [Salpingoeca rosetta]|uniref:CN hydrolase domain-containing protein n=1 Tax=Salpingoeca rosetta (strain ATCC 50818 / BSB-021) TaxID=946362 RepID=F2UAP2_SALR5|nr:uncharacterized protein PTSG_05161 [Salpingoeca rosetta]EGD73458.1 hypothetical protein PTSG_05161 [Salpingoeca rosetta]|eukprot:XP_004993740.1 hypothetical protein PTSG_05161 [Salpingoeca rosetta]
MDCLQHPVPLYVSAVSPARDEDASYVAWGHSSVVSPWGDVVATTDEKPDIIYADIDVSKVDEVRQSIPIRTQQRPDIYELVAKQAQ